MQLRDIIPSPASVTEDEGALPVETLRRLRAAPDAESACRQFATFLAAHDFPSESVEANAGLTLAVDSSLGAETWRLTLKPTSAHLTGGHHGLGELSPLPGGHA